MILTSIALVALANPHLEEGMAAFESLDFEAAHSALEEAMRGRDYRYEDVVRLLSAVGVTRAFAGDTEGARQAFRRLLAVDPGYVLSYTTSPKATFVFDEQRKALRQQRFPEISLTIATFGEAGQPVIVECTRVADPLNMISRVVLHYRDESAESFSRSEVPAPAIGASKTVSLPTRYPETNATTGILQVAVSGYDASGWEVYRGPTTQRPKEVALGLSEAIPWYGRWWVWAIAGGVAAGATAAALLATRPEPSDVPAGYTVR